MAEEKAQEAQPGDEQALSVLRGIWGAQRQSGADLDAPSNAKVCRNMKNVGFGGDAGPVDEDLRSAWRARLAREGKLRPGATSVRDLVLGPDEDREHR
jgi:hypothetical protein